MKNELLALNHFCKINGIEYVLTGTLALSILGIPLKERPNDIDIIITKIDDNGLNKLKELEALSGHKANNNYGTSSFTFFVAGIKVNAIMHSTSMDGPSFITVAISDEGNLHFINVQPLHEALVIKMGLGRSKDKEFMLNFINFLTSI